MSETLTALASENLNPSLRSLLEDVQRGHIRVPRFQRPFVWTDSQRLELLESIRDNMPIGSLLVWRTIKFKLGSFPSVGPHLIPPIAEKAPATGWQYLLDGHQRVSTLLGLLLQAAPPGLADQSLDDEPIDWDIQYDLMEEEFVFGAKARREAAKRPLLPLWTLFDGRLVNKHMRELRKREASENWTDENLDDWEVRADQLSYRFQQCRIPIVVMVADDLELAAKTFQRINSLGTPMGEAHLVAALTWRADFDLREQLDTLRADFPPGWRHIDEGLFLQVCKGLAGLDMTKAGQTELVRKLTEDPGLLLQAGERLKRAAEWLSRSAAVAGPELLPYALQVVLLALSLDESMARELPPRAYIKWFWRTSWSEVFASATYRQVKVEQERLRDAVNGSLDNKAARAEPLPVRFDFRSARVRLFMLRLAVRPGLVGANGQAVDGRDLLMAHGRDALVRLFSVPRRASPQLKKLLQGAGNRFLIEPASDGVLRERLRNGPDLTPEALDAHFVDAESLQDLRKGKLERFISARATAMDNWDAAQCEMELGGIGDDASHGCTVTKAEEDREEVLALIASEYPAVRKQAYERARDHARCDNRERFVSLLVDKFSGLLGPLSEDDRCEILRFWELAQAWKLGPLIVGYWTKEGAAIRDPLTSALRSFFTQHLYENATAAVTFLSCTLTDLASKGKPEQPTGPLLWVLAHATEQTRQRLAPDDFRKIASVSHAYASDGDRFPDLLKIRHAVG